MNHLGDLAAALVDDALPPPDRERALAHAAGCDACRDEVDAQRRVQRELRGLAAPAPSPDLTARLLALPAADLAEPAGRGRLRSLGRSGPAAGRPAGRSRRSPHPAAARRSPVRTALGAAAAVAVSLSGAVLLGGQQGDVAPPVNSFVSDHTASTVSSPLGDPTTVVLTSFSR
jgi:anti-sigma factor RsiW